jgi:DNA-binding transcriptional ArsR family regulator
VAEQTQRTPDIDPEVVQETARMLRCLGHPVRLAILDHLDRAGESTVTEIHEALDIGQAVCSQHLSLLRDRHALSRRRDGVNVLYSIADERAQKVLACLRSQSASS